MKYICLGYIEPGKFEGMTEDERHATFDACFEYNDHLRANGHLVAEVPLQPPETALTLYWKNGKVATTDGPYTETKVCMVERSWMAAFDSPEFWNPKVRGAECLTRQAARSILPIADLRTRMVITGHSKAEIVSG